MNIETPKGIAVVPDPSKIIAGSVAFKIVDGEVTLCAPATIKHNQELYQHFMSYHGRVKRSNNISKVSFLSPEEFTARRKDTENQQNLETINVGTERFAKNLLQDAVSKEASDIVIHVVQGSHCDIHFIIYGDKVLHTQLDHAQADRLCNALYNSIAEQLSDPTLSPQKFQNANISTRKPFLPEGLQGIRMESGPDAVGYHMTLRLLYLDTQESTGSLAERLSYFGYHKIQIQDLLTCLSRPSGMVIIAGTTGSGKSTTLKALLEGKGEDSPHLNIMSVEDPPEYLIKNTIQIRAETRGENGDNANFNKGIRHALRSAPDVIMIGEVRDPESGVEALQASMTGHLVLTTTHANRIFTILPRYRDLISEKMVDAQKTMAQSAVITGLVYQKLIKTLCPDCKVSFDEVCDEISPALLRRMEFVGIDYANNPDVAFRPQRKNKECRYCGGEGTVGRQIVAETCALDQKMLNAFLKGGGPAFEAVWRERNNQMDIENHAILKINMGLLDPREVEAALGPLGLSKMSADGVLDRNEISLMAGSID